DLGVVDGVVGEAVNGEGRQLHRVGGVGDVPVHRQPGICLVGFDQQAAGAGDVAGVGGALLRGGPAEVTGVAGVGDVEDHGAQVPVGQVGAAQQLVDADGVDEVGPAVGVGFDAQFPPRAPLPHVAGLGRVGHVDDPEVGPA